MNRRELLLLGSAMAAAARPLRAEQKPSAVIGILSLNSPARMHRMWPRSAKAFVKD